MLQQLPTIAIERAVSEFGGEETGCALVAILEEWRDFAKRKMLDYDSDEVEWE